MTIEQWMIFGTLLLTLVLFITGRWRYDIVALLALLIVTLTGLIPAFSMFDFSLVGVGVAIVGLVFIVLIGWRLIPDRRCKAGIMNLFEIENYVTEVRLPEGSKLVGKAIREIPDFSKAETIIIGLVRGRERRMEPSPRTILRAEDILILSSDTENIKKNGGRRWPGVGWKREVSSRGFRIRRHLFAGIGDYAEFHHAGRHG